MGTVWLARQKSLGRFVAVKLLRPFPDREESERFERESRLMASLRHSNIVFVLDRGETDGRPWIAMEHVEGQNLAEVLQQKGRYSLTEALALLRPICDALKEMHEVGVVHRDLKPGNILLESDGRPKLTDFGLAVAVSESGDLTQSNVAVGTIDYMAPEQRHRLPVDERADQFALAVITYEMLTGHRPLGAFEPASQLNERLSPDVDRVLLRGLARDPDDRFPTITHFLSALSVCLPAERKTASRPLILTLLALASLLSVAAWQAGYSFRQARDAQPADGIDDAGASVALKEPVSNPNTGSESPSAADSTSKQEDAVPASATADSTVDLDSLTVAELRSLARERGLTGYSSLVRSQLIELIELGDAAEELPPGWNSEI
jgi:serine/threonine protein kinase